MTNNNLTAEQIIEQLGKLHWSAPTDVIAIKRSSETDVSHFIVEHEYDKIAHLQEDLERSQDINDERDKKIREMEHEMAQLEGQLNEFKYEGVTPKQMFKDAEQTRENSQKWKMAMEEQQRELDLLRKRKGMWAGFVKNGGKIVEFILSVEKGEFDKQEATRLLDEIIPDKRETT